MIGSPGYPTCWNLTLTLAILVGTTISVAQELVPGQGTQLKVVGDTFEDVSWEDLGAMRKYGIRDDFVTKMYEIWNQTLIEWSKCGVSPSEIQKPSYSLLFWVQFLLMYHPEFCIFDILVIAEAYVQRMRLYEAFKEENTYEPRYMREDIDNWLAYRPYESSEKLQAYELAITAKRIRPLRTPWLDQVFCRDAILIDSAYHRK